MSSRSQRDRSQKQNVNNQTILTELLKEEPNRYCSDCKAKGPRWASWNLGVFLCIRCAGIHRNLGVHISRVKSVNLDSWTPEQMNSIQQWGNRRARDYWECYLPADFRRPETDAAVETFIRNKYERKQYASKDGLPKVSESREIKPEAKPKKKKEKRDEAPILLKSQAEKPKQVLAPATTTASKAIPRPTAQTSSIPKKPSPSVDLLSLDTPSGSSSAPAMINGVPPQAPAQPQRTSLEAELIDFGAFQGHGNTPLNQPHDQLESMSSVAADMKPAAEDSLIQDSKSAKDSIMALYQPTSQTKPMYGVPGGMYIPPQQQQQQQPAQVTPAYNNMMNPGAFQTPGRMPVGMPQMPQQPYAQQQQQQQHVAQVQQQMQQLRLNQQMQGQQPGTFPGQNVFGQQLQTTPSSAGWMPQAVPPSFPQQQPQYVSTGPAANNMFSGSMYPMGTGQNSGQTLSTQLWK